MPASATAIVRRAAISMRRARRVATGRSAIAARAVIVRHASTGMTVPVATGRLPAVRRAATTVKSARSSRARTVAARSARTRRAATARTSIATTVRRAGDRESGPRDRDDARPAARFGEKKFGEKRPYTPREGGGEKRPYTPRGEGFRRKRRRPSPRRSSRSENSAATRNSPRVARPTAARARTSAAARSRGDSKPWQKREDRGERERVPPVTARAISTSRASTGPATIASAARRSRASALLAFARGSSRR